MKKGNNNYVSMQLYFNIVSRYQATDEWIWNFGTHLNTPLTFPSRLGFKVHESNSDDTMPLWEMTTFQSMSAHLYKSFGLLAFCRQIQFVLFDPRTCLDCETGSTNLYNLSKSFFHFYKSFYRFVFVILIHILYLMVDLMRWELLTRYIYEWKCVVSLFLFDK